MVSKVKYEKLYNLGNYENEKFSAEVEVAPGADPAAAMAEAVAFVEAQRQRSADVASLEERAAGAQWIVEAAWVRLERLIRRHKDAMEQYNKFRAAAATVDIGVVVREPLFYELPSDLAELRRELFGDEPAGEAR